MRALGTSRGDTEPPIRAPSLCSRGPGSNGRKRPPKVDRGPLATHHPSHAAGLAAQGPAEGLKLRWRETVPCLEREVAGQLVFDQSPSDHDDLAGEKHL
jgi:hypothetical protein